MEQLRGSISFLWYNMLYRFQSLEIKKLLRNVSVLIVTIMTGVDIDNTLMMEG